MDWSAQTAGYYTCKSPGTHVLLPNRSITAINSECCYCCTVNRVAIAGLTRINHLKMGPATHMSRLSGRVNGDGPAASRHCILPTPDWTQLPTTDGESRGCDVLWLYVSRRLFDGGCRRQERKRRNTPTLRKQFVVLLRFSSSLFHKLVVAVVWCAAAHVGIPAAQTIVASLSLSLSIMYIFVIILAGLFVDTTK